MVSYPDVRVSLPILEEPEAGMNSAGDFAHIRPARRSSRERWWRQRGLGWKRRLVRRGRWRTHAWINPEGLGRLLRYW